MQSARIPSILIQLQAHAADLEALPQTAETTQAINDTLKLINALLARIEEEQQ